MQRAKVAELLAYCADLDKLTVDARNMSGLTATAASGVKVRKKFCSGSAIILVSRIRVPHRSEKPDPDRHCGKPDPDPRRSEKSNPEPLRGETADPDPH